MEVKLEKGAKVRLTTDPAYKDACTESIVWIESEYCTDLIKLIDVGARVALDEGLLLVIVVDKGVVRCSARRSSIHISLSITILSILSITPRRRPPIPSAVVPLCF